MAKTNLLSWTFSPTLKIGETIAYMITCFLVTTGSKWEKSAIAIP